MFKLITIFVFLISTFAFSETINKIEVDGNDRVSDQTILMFSEISVGDNLDYKDVNKILKKLYKSNFFETVSVSLESNTLNIKIKEFPIVQNVNVEGIKSKSIKEKIEKEIFFKSRTSYNEIFVNEDRNNLSNLLKDSGYYFSDIQILIEELDDNKVNVNYQIDLGKKSRIKKITFLGDKFFKDKKLKSIILSEEYKFWKVISGKKYLNESLIAYDKKLLKNFYLNKGFYNVKVNSSFAKLINENEFELIYNINPGQKIFFNNFKLNLPKDYDTNNYNELNKLFSNFKNEPYSLYKVEKILDKIELITINEQYDSVTANLEENITLDKIDITFNISETKTSYVKKINILGNNVTDEAVIRNRVAIDEGDPFNEILYTKSINSIKSLNFFRSVNSEVISDDNENTKVINISIEEKPTGEIFAGAGTGTTGTTVSFGIKENNYLGKGVSVDTVANLSPNSIKGQLILEDPNYKNSDTRVNFRLQASEVDRLSAQGFKSNKTGVSTGTNFEYFDDLFLGLSIDNFVEKISVTNKASAIQKKMAGNYFDSFVGIELNYDKRDQKFATTNGYYSNYSIDIPLLSDTGTFNNNYNYKVFTELYENNVTSAALSLGSSFSINDNDIKLSERIFIPANKLRGFEPFKVGPKDGADFIGGNYFTAFNIASTIPKILENSQDIDISIFADAANTWGIDYDGSINDNSQIRTSVGLGMNWLTPIGPLSFSYAVPITKHKNDIIENFRFNLGTSF